MNNYEIDISLYNLFILVCQNESFSKTAEILGVTQPSISYNIKKLEDYLGVKLFERGNTLIMTKEAETLLPYVEEAINSLKKGESKVNELIHLKAGQISIGVPSHIGVFLLTNIIKEFNKKYPNIKINVISKPTKELFRLLNIKEIDVLIDCSPLEPNINNFVVKKISNEKYVMACNKSKKELLNDSVELNKILDYPLIVPSRTSSSTKELMELFKKKSIPFSPLFEISTSDMIAEMIEKNIGIGYLFEKTVERYPNLKAINLNIKLPTSDIFLIYKDSLLSVTTETFIDFFKTNNI